ncbi:hypothetical protein [Tepidimonas charontis]|uniref:Uncharacterized protein n=1 Tax=Tepidimonas charontis TaxID=2267262 RepID=A0A554XKB2_9BURK|nr:hypothetical protein [Tepidimonas charontis]TSE36238.1 hypothetical protein Tchar_00289 [Tepidimonas charontis]
MLTISSIAVAPMPQTTPPVARAQPVAAARPSNAVAREQSGVSVAPQGEIARVQAQAAPSPLAPVAPVQEGQRADAMTNAAAPERSGLPLPTAVERGGPAGAVSANGATGGRPVQEQADAERDARAPSDATARATDPRQRTERAAAQAPDDPAARREGADRSAAAEATAAQPDTPLVKVKNPAQEALETQIKELLPNMWKASRAAVDMMIGEEAREAAQERAKRLEALQARLLAQPLAALPPEEAAQTYSEAAQGQPSSTAGTRIDRLA